MSFFNHRNSFLAGTARYFIVAVLLVVMGFDLSAQSMGVSGVVTGVGGVQK